MSVTRRVFGIMGLAGVSAGLSACNGGGLPVFGSVAPEASAAPPPAPRPHTPRSARYDAIYGEFPGEPFPIAAFDYTQMDPRHLRRSVAYSSHEPAGTIVIEPADYALYYVEGGGRATRYGVGVGKEGFGWNGEAKVAVRRSWPDWIPPREMIERDPTVAPRLTQTARGMGVPGGLDSPLGARAMILAANGQDSGYRIHGTTEPDTIGTNVSSGCIRLVNQDVIHLYGRTVQSNRVLVAA
ncbi:L,D-transpeptidase [Enterovirga rhinocerotis]|uniref:Lipoprotein-anchoring transpeptidase ErfK/SrfK n=1 Tax=Enterovirga rhinocerotis TaxID=1339210 RepID=A0A4R7BV19_9HYPH|nr:L,D-transpeptidase [Enterovirga rhinocerotis]TDR89660.1 lipoprotein-anchoring transpeptidase ErfK/SrfK [Enterovirga rhinocerotis]